jgi:hypothetical protein
MNKGLELLRQKYLFFDDDGEVSGFDNKIIDKIGYDLHSDLVELFDGGYYYTNNEKVVKELENLLKKEGIYYDLRLNESVFFKFEIYLLG